MKTTMMKKENTAMDYLGYALYAFGGLGIEILLMMLETSLWGISSGNWTMTQNILHWSVTCAIWGVLAFLLSKHIPKQHSKIEPVNVILVALMMLVSIAYTSIVWQGLKPVLEFTSQGLPKFIVQYIYYAFESILIVWIIIFAQMFFEKLIGKKTKIPVGGMILALTWGLIHILTQDIHTGMYACIQACLFGFVYLILHRRVKLSYVAIMFMFML